MARSIFTHATADDKNRLELIRLAGAEIDAISGVLDLLIEGDKFDRFVSIWPGLHLRLSALASVVQSAVDDRLEGTEALACAMFGGRAVKFDAAKWLGMATEDVGRG